MARKYRVAVIVLLALVLLAWWALRSPMPEGVRGLEVNRFTLANGLEVVVLPSQRVPAVAHLMFVRAGGADDPKGLSGLAHYLEHLMFTGTARYPEGEYERAVVRVGGTQNAYTTRDYTAYFSVVPSAELATIMAMEADRFTTMRFDSTKAARELKVITEERQTRVDNDAGAQLAEQLDAITFLNHPYRQPLIGWPEDMARLTTADAQAYFDAHYTASNMVLVLAGDITASTAKRLAEHYYGGLAAGKPYARQWANEPVHRLGITATMKDDKARERRLVRQYVVPSATSAGSQHSVPLSVLAEYMGGGQAGVLYQRLVRERQLATLVEMSYDGLAAGPSVLRVIATPAAGVTLESLAEALDNVLREVQSTPPDRADLARAKAGLKAGVIFAQDGLLPLAQMVGELIMIGKDEQYFYDWPNAVAAVMPEQVQQAAALLPPTQGVTGYLLPKANPAPAAEVPHAP